LNPEEAPNRAFFFGLFQSPLCFTQMFMEKLRRSILREKIALTFYLFFAHADLNGKTTLIYGGPVRLVGRTITYPWVETRG